jgi:UDP-N-acetylglucosamine:LPS N-acetylglucosamine transferase
MSELLESERPSMDADSALRGCRVLLVCSSGGHLAQLLSLQPWLLRNRPRWVTFPTEDALSLLAGQDVVAAHFPTTRNIPNLLRNGVLAWRLLREDRPDVVLSTGAGAAVPFFVLARLLRIPSVYIEVYDRLDSRTMTGRLCRPFATRMLVQWEEQQQLYRGSTVVGPLL